MVKNKSRKPIVFLAVLLIIIVAVALIGYKMLFNSVDPEEKVAIDQEMDKITQDILEGIQGGIKPIESSPEGNEAADEASSDSTGENTQPGTDLEGEEHIQKNEAIAQTLAAYENGFLKLQQEGNAIVDRLVEGIKSDYKSLLDSGAGKLELAKLASSYTNRAKALESGIDSSVNILTSKMKEDLMRAGMSEGEAQEYISRLKEEYKKQKEERRKLILDKAKEYL